MISLLLLTGLMGLLHSARPEWTSWLDTDTPEGRGDFENVESINKRGHKVCDSDPLRAECRISGSEETFSEQSLYSQNHLRLACSNQGLVCLNSDQVDLEHCHNYEIRFFCGNDDTATASILGLAAGISVLLPILCVVFVHVVKATCQKHRRSATLDDPETPRENEISAHNNNDAPPSYETLFADRMLQSYGSQEALLDISDASRPTTRNSDHGHSNSVSSDVEGPQPRTAALSAQTNSRIPSQNHPIFLISTGETHIRSANAYESRLPLPGMHISIFDLFHYDDQQTTPPPTYDEAIVITEQMSKNKLMK
ncbi:hypothetical protein ScPMuIL_018625 [Solemya velum]